MGSPFLRKPPLQSPLRTSARISFKKRKFIPLLSTFQGPPTVLSRHTDLLPQSWKTTIPAGQAPPTHLPSQPPSRPCRHTLCFRHTALRTGPGRAGPLPHRGLRARSLPARVPLPGPFTHRVPHPPAFRRSSERPSLTSSGRLLVLQDTLSL